MTDRREPVPSAAEGFARLVEIMARLRAPGGCPWDREQNFDTIKPYLLEETYEVLDAVDARDWDGLCEPLYLGYISCRYWPTFCVKYILRFIVISI